jgi:hypothetical protein
MAQFPAAGRFRFGGGFRSSGIPATRLRGEGNPGLHGDQGLTAVQLPERFGWSAAAQDRRLVGKEPGSLVFGHDRVERVPHLSELQMDGEAVSRPRGAVRGGEHIRVGVLDGLTAKQGHGGFLSTGANSANRGISGHFGRSVASRKAADVYGLTPA